MAAGVVEAIVLVVSCLLLPPLLDGVRRKVYALLQRRVGPPVLQTYYDLAKLFSRRASAPYTMNPLAYSAPIASLAYVVTASLLVSMPSAAKLLGGVVGFTLALAASVMVLVAGVAGLSPFTSVGSVRLLLLAGIAECGLLLSLVAISMSAGVLPLPPWLTGTVPGTAVCVVASIALALGSYIESELAPFNVVEAGPEIAAGPYTEYGGQLLGFTMLSSFYRSYLLAAISATILLLPWLGAPLSFYAGILGGVVICLVAYMVSGLFGRPTPQRALAYTVAIYVAGVASMVLALA